jgi:hypothetical protein
MWSPLLCSVKQEKVTMSIWHVLQSTASKRRSRRKLCMVNSGSTNGWSFLWLESQWRDRVRVFPWPTPSDALFATSMANQVALELKSLLSGLRYYLAFASFTSMVTISKTIFSDSRLQSWLSIVSFCCCIFLDGFLTFLIWFNLHSLSVNCY